MPEPKLKYEDAAKMLEVASPASELFSTIINDILVAFGKRTFDHVYSLISVTVPHIQRVTCVSDLNGQLPTAAAILDPESAEMYLLFNETSMTRRILMSETRALKASLEGDPIADKLQNLSDTTLEELQNLQKEYFKPLKPEEISEIKDFKDLFDFYTKRLKSEKAAYVRIAAGCRFVVGHELLHFALGHQARTQAALDSLGLDKESDFFEYFLDLSNYVQDAFINEGLKRVSESLDDYRVALFLDRDSSYSALAGEESQLAWDQYAHLVNLDLCPGIYPKWLKTVLKEILDKPEAKTLHDTAKKLLKIIEDKKLLEGSLEDDFINLFLSYILILKDPAKSKVLDLKKDKETTIRAKVTFDENGNMKIVPKNKTCDTCHGTGQVQQQAQHPQNCPCCNGTGQVSKESLSKDASENLDGFENSKEEIDKAIDEIDKAIDELEKGNKKKAEKHLEKAKEASNNAKEKIEEETSKIPQKLDADEAREDFNKAKEELDQAVDNINKQIEDLKRQARKNDQKDSSKTDSKEASSSQETSSQEETEKSHEKSSRSQDASDASRETSTLESLSPKEDSQRGTAGAQEDSSVSSEKAENAKNNLEKARDLTQSGQKKLSAAYSNANAETVPEDRIQKAQKELEKAKNSKDANQANNHLNKAQDLTEQAESAVQAQKDNSYNKDAKQKLDSALDKLRKAQDQINQAQNNLNQQSSQQTKNQPDRQSSHQKSNDFQAPSQCSSCSNQEQNSKEDSASANSSSRSNQTSSQDGNQPQASSGTSQGSSGFEQNINSAQDSLQDALGNLSEANSIQQGQESMSQSTGTQQAASNQTSQSQSGQNSSSMNASSQASSQSQSAPGQGSSGDNGQEMTTCPNCGGSGQDASMSQSSASQGGMGQGSAGQGQRAQAGSGGSFSGSPEANQSSVCPDCGGKGHKHNEDYDNDNGFPVKIKIDKNGNIRKIEIDQESLSQSQREQLNRRLEGKSKQMLTSAAQTPELENFQKSRGLGSAYGRLLEEIQKVKFDWRSIYANQVKAEFKEEPKESWLVPLKQLKRRGITLPDKYPQQEEGKCLLLLLDASGSMSDKEVKDVLGITISGLRQYQRVYLGFHDYDLFFPLQMQGVSLKDFWFPQEVRAVGKKILEKHGLLTLVGGKKDRKIEKAALKVINTAIKQGLPDGGTSHCISMKTLIDTGFFKIKQPASIVLATDCESDLEALHKVFLDARLHRFISGVTVLNTTPTERSFDYFSVINRAGTKVLPKRKLVIKNKKKKRVA